MHKIDEQPTNKDVHITPGQENLEDLYELSPMQQGMFFHSLYAPGSGVYLEQSLLTIEGELDHAAFQRAWQQAVDRHSILPTGVLGQGLEKPVQVVYRQLEFEIEQHDWRQLSADEQHQQLELFIRNDQARGFDLERAPLMRAALIHVADNVYKFLWSRHHLILDRWSRALLLNEVFSFYNAFSRDLNLEIEPSRPYGDYIGWLLAQDRAAAESFWRHLLAGFASPTPLGFESHGAHGGEEKQYDYQSVRLSAEATSSLREFAREQKLTMNTLVQGAWALLLSRYSGEQDVLFGATVSGRPADLAGVEKMVGLFINTLPVRVKLSPRSSLSSWLRSLQEQQSEQRQYEYSSLIDIQGWSEIPRGAPLIESILVFENLPVESVFHEAESMIAIRGDRSIGSKTSYPLTVMVDPGAALSLQIVYDRDRFDAAAIDRLLQHFALLLQNFTGAEDRPLREISFLEQAELNRVLIEWNETTTPSEDAICLHQVFEEQVRRAGERIAVKYGDNVISYRELNQRANKLAGILVARGVKSEAIVGICLNRSIETYVGILAVLQAGGAYLPLDPVYPGERLQFMARDSELTLLLTQRSLVEKFAGTTAPVLLLDALQDELAAMSGENPGLNADPDNLAYLMYTSGSTGQPKGVAATHRATMNRCSWMWRVYPFGPDEVCCQKTSLSFVDSVWEIFGPLLQGTASVIIPDEILKDPFLFVETLGAHKVTRLVLVPSLLRVLLETVPELEQKLPQLKLWVTSGEALPTDLVEKFNGQLPQSLLLNLYGASEVAADVTCYQVAGGESSKSVPIGRPISNTEIYILDSQMQPVPIGVVGELYIGGTNLARGYHNRPDLTAEKFVVNPFGKAGGGRLYRTGDLACYRPDGNIEYRGRVDNQVKLRGFRIEPGEIEGTLRRHAAVADAVVVLREDQASDPRLVAYVVGSSANAVQASELRSFLRQTLPDYMVPSIFVTMEALPLTRGGKVDRQALPKPEASNRELQQRFVAPRNVDEERIAAIWQTVLQVDRVGIRDNFFELGGHSMSAMQLMSELSKAYGKRIPLATLFQVATVEHLAQFIANDEPYAQLTLLQIKPGKSHPPFFCVSAPNVNALGYVQLAQHLAEDQPVYALQAAFRKRSEGEYSPDEVEALATEYIRSMRQLQPEGPYMLGGMCAGGLIAFEMARQLREKGQQIALVGIFDTWNIHTYTWLWVVDYYWRRFKTLLRQARGGDLNSAITTAGRSLRTVLKKFLPGAVRPQATVPDDPWRTGYVPPPDFVPNVYPGRLTVFRIHKRPYYRINDEALGWGQRALGGVDIEVIPGDHDSIFREPNVRVLAEKLTEHIMAIRTGDVPTTVKGKEVSGDP